MILQRGKSLALKRHLEHVRKDGGELGRQYTTGLVKNLGEGDESRTVRYRISTPQIDRHGDTLAPLGCKWDNYLLNPVILWAHQQSALPIGGGSNPSKDANGVELDKTFFEPELLEFADKVFQMVKRGILNACSVGFDPINWEWADLRDETRGFFDIDYLEWDLCESSPCPIPANPGALQKAHSEMGGLHSYKQFVERELDLAPDPERLEEVFKAWEIVRGFDPRLFLLGERSASSQPQSPQAKSQSEPPAEQEAEPETPPSPPITPNEEVEPQGEPLFVFTE